MANFHGRFVELASKVSDEDVRSHLLILALELANFVNKDANPDERQMKAVFDVALIDVSLYRIKNDWPSRKEVMLLATYVNSCRS